MSNSTTQLQTPSKKKTLWAWLVGTFFGAGLLKPGPGTYGSISAVLLWYATAHLLHPSPIPLAIGTAIAAILATLIGIPAATIVARESGREDPGHVVIDEVAGQWFALLPVALMARTGDWLLYLIAFLLFRAFDILKPWPIAAAERLPGGLGVMMDDVLAGIVSAILFYGILAMGWM